MTHLVLEHVLINGSRICHGIHGAGEPVILIHGTPSSSYIWRNIVPALTVSGYQCHLYDLLGYGLSERPWDPAVDTSVTGQVDVLLSLMQEWGLETAHIIAHDIGGGVAQRLAVLHQEKLRSLTMIDVVSFDSWPSKRTHEQMQAGLESLIKAPDEVHRAHFQEWLLSTVQNKERFAESSLQTFLDFISNPMGQGSLFQHQVMHYQSKHTEDVCARLDELEGLPTQIIWGADDAWQVLAWAHKLREAIPGSELHVLEECGHFAMEDQPEKIAALLTGFLNRNT